MELVIAGGCCGRPLCTTRPTATTGGVAAQGGQPVDDHVTTVTGQTPQLGAVTLTLHLELAEDLKLQRRSGVKINKLMIHLNVEPFTSMSDTCGKLRNCFRNLIKRKSFSLEK